MENIEQKKEENICEYIVHMYQTEDLLRVYEFDLGKIDEYVIHHLPVDEREKTAFHNWYEELSLEMEKEGIRSQGHLSRVQSYVHELTDLHERLLLEDDAYQDVFDKAEPFINHHINLSEGKISNPVQICLNGVYGLLLLRLNGRDIEDELMERLDQFGNVLSYLSMKFNPGI